MKHILISILIISAFLPACSPKPAELPTEINTDQTAAETAWTETAVIAQGESSTTLPEPTSTQKPSTAGTISPTPPLTTDEMESQILQNYKIFLVTQISAELLLETAQRISSGELEGMEGFALLLAIGSFTKAVDEALAETTPLDPVAPYWEDVNRLNRTTNDYIVRWIDKEIDSSIVIGEFPPVTEEIDTLVSDVEKTMSKEWGYDRKELSKFREETIDSLYEVFEGTPAPTSSLGEQ